MKYIVAVVAGALLIGSVLSVAVYFLWGSSPAFFFAKFIAGPVGLASSFALFILYDSKWPKNGKKR